MNKYFFYVALIGWVLSVIIHLMAVGGIDVQSTIPFVWVMHIGIFPLWFAAIMKLKKNPEIGASKDLKPNPTVMFKAMFANTPGWMIALALGGFGYAMINFFLFMTSDQGEAVMESGRYILERKGHFIRELSLEEYTKQKANTVRGFSGHWILFYGIATAILYPAREVK